MATPLVKFVKAGDTVDYTPSVAVSAGDVVVQEELVAVATGDIAASAKGALHVSGEFDFPKSTGSTSAIAAGKKVYWDATNEVATETVGANKLIGKVTTAAVVADTTVRVRMNQ